MTGGGRGIVCDLFMTVCLSTSWLNCTTPKLTLLKTSSSSQPGQFHSRISRGALQASCTTHAGMDGIDLLLISWIVATMVGRQILLLRR